MMNKAEALEIADMYAKYGLALSMLHPSQLQDLREALAYYRRNGRLADIKDSFVNLAYRMVIADWIWTERMRGENNGC